MPRIPLPIGYIDRLRSEGHGSVVRPHIINRIPEPGETDVPSTGAIELTIIDVDAVGLAAKTKVTVISNVGTVIAYDQAGLGFHATYLAGSTSTVQASPGSGVNDEHLLQLVRDTDFDSLETVTIQVYAETLDGLILNKSYTYQIEDLTQPQILRVYSQGLRTVIIEFNEAMCSSGVGDVSRVRDVSGRITFSGPNIIEVENGAFSMNSVGDYIAITGSEQALNNAYYQIVEVYSDKLIRVTPATIRTELPLLAVRAWTGPYKLEGLVPDGSRTPVFSPAITKAEFLYPSAIKLTLDQELSIGRPYRLHAYNIGDAADPVNLVTTSFDFTAETWAVAHRDFSLWDMIPDVNKREDTTGDLERLIRCFDDVVQINLRDSDLFQNLIDPDSSPEGALDALLGSLGNPFTFVDTVTMKRRLATNLVRLYKDAGIDRSVEEAVWFFLNLVVHVEPYNDLDPTWILGISELGIGTILGTDLDFLRYSFQIRSESKLDDTQRAIITEITNFCKPAHTHFVRFVEP